ncbi:MAG: PDZ domain-containing protein [Phycisphaerae bacterium]
MRSTSRGKRRARPGRAAGWRFAIALTILFGLSAALPAVAAPPADWAALAPADVRLYVEFRDLSVTRHHLARVGTWDTIRALGEAGGTSAGRPAVDRAEQLLGMSTERAILELLGARTALFAIDPARWDRGVVLAELGSPERVAPLLQRWAARPLEPLGDVQRYRMKTGLLVAVRDRTLLFGPAQDDDGLWTRATLLLAGRGGPTLARQPAFARARETLPVNGDGFVFIAREEAGRGSLLASIDVAADAVAIDFRATGNVPHRFGPPTTRPAGALAPADAIGVWCGALDVAGFFELATSQPSDPYSLTARLRAAMFELAGVGASALGALGPSAAIVLSAVADPGGRGFDLPAVALVLETSRPLQSAVGFDGLVILVSTFILELAPGSRGAAMPQLDVSQEGDVEVRRVPIGQLMASRTRCPYFAQVELVWAAVDRWLVVSTSRRQFDEILATLRGARPALRNDRVVAATLSGAAGPNDWVVLRGAALSNMLRSWLSFLERTNPPAQTAAFWTDWAKRRIEEQQRLGVGVRRVAGNDAAVEVVEISPDSPAAGRLQIGDQILGVSGAPLSTSRPAQELVERFHARTWQGSLPLSVRRAGQPMEVSIPLIAPTVRELESFNPAAAVRLIADLAERVETLTVQARPGGGGDIEGRVLVRWSPPRRTETRSR